MPPSAGAATAATRRDRMLEEIRIRPLGVIDSSTLELGPGLTVITGETGAGKTMVVTALGLLLGGRADTGAVRTGAQAGARRGRRRRRRRCPAFAAPSRRPGARSRTTGSCWRATSPPRAARAPGSVAPRCRCPRSPSVAEPLVAVHGQSDQHRLLQPGAQRDALDRFGGAEVGRGGRGATPTCTRELGRRPSASWPRCVGTARERAREADLLRFGLGEIEAVDPSRARTSSWPPRRAGSASPTPCARPPSRPARRCRSERGRPDALGARRSAARTLLEGVREHDPEAGELADRLAEVGLPALRRRRRRRVVRRRAGDRPGPAGRQSRERGRR